MSSINRNVYDDTLFHRCMAIQQKGAKCEKVSTGNHNSLIFLTLIAVYYNIFKTLREELV